MLIRYLGGPAVFQPLVTKRRFLPFLAAVAALLGAAPAGAAISEISPLGENRAGCPGFAAKDCAIIVVRQTGFQAKVGPTRAFTTAKTDGRLVAWSVSLFGTSESDTKKLSDGYGGTPKIAPVVLNGLGKSRYRVVQKGALVDVSDYLGTTPTFALEQSLPVKKGQVIGLTIPTWAPILQLGMGSDTSWRSSRPLKETVAGNFSRQRALVGETTDAGFGALYQRARLAYSAYIVPTPAKKKKPSAKKSTTKKSSSSTKR